MDTLKERKQAMKWWYSFTESEKDFLAHKYKSNVLLGIFRKGESLTGREVENIYKIETKN